jgi:hypothetical protein
LEQYLGNGTGSRGLWWVDQRLLWGRAVHEPTNRRGPRRWRYQGAITARQGTGLGLSMVHDLATQAYGALRLISQPGQGTTAELWLPRAPAIRNETHAPAPNGTHNDGDHIPRLNPTL